MKPFHIIGLLLAISVLSRAESVRITEENIAFAYEIKAEIPTSPEILAGMVSVDYLNARDEFTAHEMFEKIEPVIKKRLQTARETKLWRIEITDQLAPYDFESKSFPTQLTENTFIPFSASNQQYAIVFANHEAFRNVPVAPETAKRLSANLRKSRNSTTIVEGTVKDAHEKLINYGKRKTIVFEISKVSIKLKDGELVGEYAPVSADGLSKTTVPAVTKVNPVGEWSTRGAARMFSLELLQSGEARGKFEETGSSISLEGNWQIVKDGRWSGYVTFSGKVKNWTRGQTDVTPGGENFNFLFDPAGSQLVYVRGGDLRDKDGGVFHPSGVQANEDPVLHRKSGQMP